MVVPPLAPSTAVPAEHPDFDANVNLEVTNRLTAEATAGRTPAQILAATETLLNGRPARGRRPAEIGLRQQFAETVARHTDTGFRRGSKEGMDNAAWEYAIALGMAGACAFSEMVDSAEARRAAAGDPPDVAASEAEARRMAALQYVHRDEGVIIRAPGARRGGRTVHGEGAMLADAVADARRGRVNADTTRRGVRSWPNRAFNTVAEGWGRLGRRTRTTIKVAATVGTIAATIVTAGASSPLSAVRKKTFDALDHRAEVLNSHDQNNTMRQEISDAYRTGGAVGRVPTLRQMVQPHTNMAETRHRRNRRNTYFAVGTLVVSGVLGDVVANNIPGIEFVAKGVGHGIHEGAHFVDHLAHDQIAGYGSHAGNAAAAHGGTSAPAGAASAPGSTAPLHLPGSETVGKPLDVLNTHQTADLHRSWINSKAATSALKNQANSNGVEITTQGLNLPHHGAEALLIVHTEHGNELIEVPLNSHGATEVHGPLAELLKTHGEVTEEVGTIAKGHADIYATAVGHGTEVGQSAVTHMAQEAVAAPGHATELAFTPAQLHELTLQQADVYKEFAANVHGVHGATTEGLFGQAVTHAIATHQLELVTTSHGGLEIVDPSVGINPAASGHIYQMLLKQLEETANANQYDLTLAA